MKLINIQFLTIYTIIFITIFSCKDKQKEDFLNFTLIEKNSYFIDSYNGIAVYKDNTTRKPLNGYYVVGDKFKKWEEFKVNKGILNGTSIIFHSNGSIFSESNYLNGKLNGDEKIFALSGNLKTINTYKNGIKYGKSLSYFENGKIKSESKIKDEKVIESVSYDLLGNIESQMFIDDGKKITQYIQGGKVLSEHISSTYDDFEATKFYNEDGSLKLFIQMLEDGDNFYFIERNEAGDEIKRINAKTNPEEILKYQQLINNPKSLLN
ncbi:toxin-antitoxin system YwqK family antitoxin [Thalassobellus sediminis]|uniref:toxin-antitoxin system YwqK family antitoxin n=1 Tax=Thalassobellus sediminis TaxID=3367753 RepID=UPI003792753E